MARRRFFVDEVRLGQAQVVGDDAHHLTRVLRVEPGQRYEISDNHGVYLAEVQEARKSLVTFTVVEKLATEEPLVRVTLFASLIRFERFEWMIEKVTELGVESIVPVEAGRSEKGLEHAAGKRLSRWKRIAREASEQSRRVRVPDLTEPLLFREALASTQPHRLFLDEDPGAQPILAALPSPKTGGAEVAILAGPEGGWTDREREAAAERGWTRVSLGPMILKTETATLAALAILQAAWQGAANQTNPAVPV